MTDYAVVITFPGGIAEELNRLRADYRQYVRYRIEPHLTLAYPFLPQGDMVAVNEKLAAVSETTKPFTLTLSGIEYFQGKNNVAYVAVEDKGPVKELHVNIERALSGLIRTEYVDGQYSLDSFVPHVTIAERIPDELLPSVMERFAGYKIHYEIEVFSFSLFSSDEDAVWKRNCSFRFSG